MSGRSLPDGSTSVVGKKEEDGERITSKKYTLDKEEGLKVAEEDKENKEDGEQEAEKTKEISSDDKGHLRTVVKDNSKNEPKKEPEKVEEDNETPIELIYKLPGLGTVESVCDLVEQSKNKKWLLIGIDKEKKKKRRANIFRPEKGGRNDNGKVEGAFGLVIRTTYEDENGEEQEEEYELSKVVNVGGTFDSKTTGYEMWTYLIVKDEKNDEENRRT